jgi:hypothetical protein
MMSEVLEDADEFGERRGDEIDAASLLLSDGYCIILDRSIFMSKLDMPMMVRMTGSQIWIYWYRDGEWTFSEVKARETSTPKKTSAVSVIRGKQSS